MWDDIYKPILLAVRVARLLQMRNIKNRVG